jgi:hypothetical protein
LSLARTRSRPRKYVVSRGAEGPPAEGHPPEVLGHPRHLGEPVAERDPVEAPVERLVLEPLRGADVRVVEGLDVEEDHPVVEHLVVLEVVEEGRRRPLRVAVEVDGRPRHPRGPLLEVGEGEGERERRAGQPRPEDRPPAPPRRHAEVGAGGDEEGDPPAVRHLHDVGAPEPEVHEEERRREGDDEPERPPPPPPHHHEQEHRRDRHVRRHADAVGRRQRA